MANTPSRAFYSTRPAVALGAMLMGAPLSAAALLAPASIASAQEAAATRVDPYVVVVTVPEVPVRAGSSIYFYPIVLPKPGDTLVVDGETTGWLRVAYPENVRALVAADEAQEAAAGTVRLTRASKLKAPNARGGVKAAFLSAMETELPIGTEFKVFETVKDDNGKVTFYVVEAPSGARGFISRDAVRRATESEAAPVLAKLGSGLAAAPVSPNLAAPKVETPAPVVPAVPTPSPATAVTPAPTAVTPPPTVGVQPGTEPAPTTPPKVEPVAIPTIAPAPTAPASGEGQPGATPAAPPPGMEIPGTVPVGDKDGGGSGGRVRSPQTSAVSVGSVSTMDGLKALYDRVRAQPPESAELEQAIAEFERFKGTLADSARDRAVAKQLDAYISVMQIRKDVRDAQSANASLSRDTELMKTEVGKRVIELEKQRVYTLIGRLVRSTVYDGGRAPELYRVMSPEPGSARTLGYLLPDPKFDYSNKLEQVVGIIGELRPDESLRTNLIIPKRVDVVSLAPIVMSPELPGAVVRTEPAEKKATPPSSAPSDAAKPAGEMPKLPAKPAIAPPTPAPGGEPEKP
jgi:hypothetical protein